MKKLIYICVLATMSLCLCSCKKENVKDETADNNQTYEQQSQETEEITTQLEEMDDTDNVVDYEEDISFEEINEMIEQDTEDTITALSGEWEEIKTDIDTYDKYIENVDAIEAFYLKINEENKLLCIRLREYSLIYAKMILSSNMSYDDMYEELEEIYDRIYDDAGEDIYDDIYDGILDDMYDCFYDGILDDAYDTVEYDEWSDARSDEYEWWSDTRSDVYDEYSDYRSEVYEFYSDLRSAIWDDDIEKAMEEVTDFEEDLSQLKE